MNRASKVTLAALAFIASSVAMAEEESKQKGALGGLFQKLEQGLKSLNPQTQDQNHNGSQTSASKAEGVGAGVDPDRDQCYNERIFGVALSKTTPNTEALIQQEFAIPLDQVFSAFNMALRSRRNISYAFPNAKFYAGEFETRRVNILYSSFIYYPEAPALGLIIDEALNSKDEQTRTDATVALAFIHLQMPQASKNPGRGQQLLDSLKSRPHYTYNVYLARRAAVGEGVPKNLREANGLLQNARTGGTASMVFGGGAGVPVEFDRANFRLAAQKTIIENDPSRAADYRKYEESGQKALYGLKNKPSGRIIERAFSLSRVAMQEAEAILASSGRQSTRRAYVQSFTQFLDNRKNDPDTVVSPNPDVDREIASILAKTADIDQEKRVRLSEALAKRAGASMLFNRAHVLALQEISEENGVKKNNPDALIDGIAAIASISRFFEEAKVQNCAIYAKWEQGARLSQIPEPSIEAKLERESATADVSW